MSSSLLMSTIVFDGKKRTQNYWFVWGFFFSFWWYADNWWGVFDSANWQLPSMQCVVGGGLGLDKVKRRYCLEVSNPTQNKEDGRNVLRSPISVLKAAELHTYRHTYRNIYAYEQSTCMSIHAHTQNRHMCTHISPLYLAPYSPADTQKGTQSRTHKHQLTHTCTLSDKQPETDKIITTFKLTFSSG